jgi:signal transduction histidine kinase
MAIPPKIVSNHFQAKKPEMFHSIRWRLVASYVLLTLISISLAGVLASEIVRRYIQEQEVEKLHANAQSIAQQLLPLMWVKNSVPQINSLTKAASFLGDVRVRVLDSEGHILADSGRPAGTEELVLVYPPEGSEDYSFRNEAWLNLIMPVMDQTFPFGDIDPEGFENLPTGTTFQYVQRSTGPWGGRISFDLPMIRESLTPTQSSLGAIETARSTIVIQEPIGASTKPLGHVELSAGQDFGSAALATTRRAFLFAGAGATLLSVVVGLMMSQRLTSPLRSLQETAQRMSSGDLSARADYQRPDEIGNLAAQFNQMADQLQANIAQLEKERDELQRFISDASHELRTPITALKNFLTLIMGPAAQDPLAQSEFLAESQTQIDRLEWITRNLLDLSRLNAGLVDLEFDNHDLGELITTASAPFKPLAEAKGINLVIQYPDSSLMLWCDASHLEMVLTNLLDNALKFTPPGGEIAIHAKRTSQVTQIWITDTGTGIHPDELPYIFDRFYRGRAHTAQGSGLGLSIAKSLVEAQGGNIRVESIVDEGTKFVIEFQNSVKDS